MSSSQATGLPRAELYRSLSQAIYDEMDRQSVAGQKNPELLDRMHELLQVGIPFQLGERVMSVFGDNAGKSGAISSLSLTANYVEYDDGTTELLPFDWTQRDWIALAGG